MCLSAGAGTAAAQDPVPDLFASLPGALPDQTPPSQAPDPLKSPAQVAEAFPRQPATSTSLFEAVQVQAPPPAEPEHTGIGALVRSIGGDFATFPRRKSTWVILAAGAAGAALVHPWDDDVTQNLSESDGAKKFFKLGKYLGASYVQASAAIGMYVIGRYAMKPEAGSRTNKWSHMGFDLLRAQILSQAFVQGIKYVGRRDRPDGTCCAFPSGHAATAFATASVIERHFGYRGAWPTMAIAAYVGASRLADNRHFLSDVVFGSALGIASGWTVVGRHGKENFALMPVPIRGGVALTFTRVYRPDSGRDATATR